MAQAVSPGRTLCERTPGLLIFVVDRVTLGQVFVRALRFSTLPVIPPTLHTQLRLHVALTRMTRAAKLRKLQKSSALSAIGDHWIEKWFHIFILQTTTVPWLRRLIAGLSPRFRSRLNACGHRRLIAGLSPRFRSRPNACGQSVTGIFFNNISI